MALHSKYTRAQTFANVCQEARGHAEEEDAREHWEAEQLAKEEEERTQIEAEEEEGNRCAVLAKTNDSWQGLGKSQGEVVTEWIREVRQWMKEDSRSLLPQQRPTKRSLSPQRRPRILSQDHNSATQSTHAEARNWPVLV